MDFQWVSPFSDKTFSNFNEISKIVLKIIGTTAYMIMANQKPEYQQYIQLANLMAPVAYVDHMKSPLRFLSPFINQLDVSENMIYIYWWF